MQNGASKDIDDYIASQRDNLKAALEELRSLIRSIASEAEEQISYQVPCFKYHYMLVGMGVSKNHCSFYTMNPELIQNLKPELKDFKVSESTIHLSPDKPYPQS